MVVKIWRVNTPRVTVNRYISLLHSLGRIDQEIINWNILFTAPPTNQPMYPDNVY